MLTLVIIQYFWIQIIQSSREHNELTAIRSQLPRIFAQAALNNRPHPQQIAAVSIRIARAAGFNFGGGVERSQIKKGRDMVSCPIAPSLTLLVIYCVANCITAHMKKKRVVYIYNIRNCANNRK